MTNLKRGMSSFNVNDIPLKFSKYVNKKALPSVPLRFGHVLVDAPHGGWGMLGNDQYGDCTCAGIAHIQMVWDWASSRDIPAFTAAGIVEQYMQLTGGADTGCDPTAVAEYWKTSGLLDSSGTPHKVSSYTGIDTVDQAVEAAYLFGASGLGLWLPEDAESQFEDGSVWNSTDNPPQQDAGHFVPLVGRNSAGNLMVVTWGRLHAATPAWIDKYFAGGVAYTSREYLRVSGKSPDGFNFAQLQEDLASL